MELLFQCSLMTLSMFTVRAFDPCALGNHHEFPTHGFGARNDNCSQQPNAPCDSNLEQLWYRASLGSLWNKCPTVGSCGVEFPAWIYGSFPSVADGIANLTVCIKSGVWCCRKPDLRALIKNCNGFYVYNLPALHKCPSAYCFSSELSCEVTTSTRTSTTSTRTSTTSTRTSTTSTRTSTTSTRISTSTSTPKSYATTLSNASELPCEVITSTRTSTAESTPKTYVTTFSNENNDSRDLVTKICVGAGVVLGLVGTAIAFYFVLIYKSDTRSRKTVPIEVKPTSKEQLHEDHIHVTFEARPPNTTAIHHI